MEASWSWTGMRRNEDGTWSRTGLQVVLGPLRFHTFPVPTRTFGVSDRRVCLELGRLHLLATWRSGP